MDIFGTPNIDRMAASNDYEGLYKALENRNKVVRLQAAQALARMNDGSGWRFLMDAVRQTGDPDSQDIAASMLGELGHPRAVPLLGDLLYRTRFEPVRADFASVLREALEAIGGPEAEEALRKAGYDPAIDQEEAPDGTMEDAIISDYDAQFVRPILPRTDTVVVHTAEEHLNSAVELREAEIPERGLVECSLAQMLSPDWAYAWYLRGVLFEDLDRAYEAMLAYRQAIALEPSLSDAQDALNELVVGDDVDPVEMEVVNNKSVDTQNLDRLIANLSAREWETRRDAAAGIGQLARRADDRARAAVDTLIELLNDEDREVRHAVIEALGVLDDRRAILPLLKLEESSLLVRFAILRTLSQLGSVEGLVSVLRREMTHLQDRNYVLSSHKDPLLDVKYETMMEAGALALEQTRDIEGLLFLAEGNAWEEVDEEEDEDASDDADADGEYTGEYDEDDEEIGEVDEDLTSYVDETAMMIAVALERLATPNLEKYSPETLQRLANVPDLTLMDLSGDTPEMVVVHDLSALREAAAAALDK